MGACCTRRRKGGHLLFAVSFSPAVHSGCALLFFLFLFFVSRLHRSGLCLLMAVWAFTFLTSLRICFFFGGNKGKENVRALRSFAHARIFHKNWGVFNVPRDFYRTRNPATSFKAQRNRFRQNRKRPRKCIMFLWSFVRGEILCRHRWMWEKGLMRQMQLHFMLRFVGSNTGGDATTFQV